jgi:hypothetical protein
VHTYTDTNTHARLDNDYCTTCTDTDTHARLDNNYCTTCTDIDRYTHTHTHTLNSQNRFLDLSIPRQCVVQQEAVNSFHVDPRSREAKEVGLYKEIGAVGRNKVEWLSKAAIPEI